jgi:WS/DGAT/MGAT family acyltransferase
MEALSGLDSSFLYLEDAHQPMHVGSVLVYEGSMNYESFRETMASRVHLVPRLRQRLAMVPFGIGKPYWVEDPAFNLDMHLQHVALPSPGSWKELRGLAARIFSVPLDRSRPLWEMTFVEGLDQIPQVPPGSVAVINKIHHAAIDGVSGADMMSVLLDMTKEPRTFSPPPPRAIPHVPNELVVLSHTARKIMGKPTEIKRVAGEITEALRAAAKVRDKGVDAPPVPMTAPPTPINHTITGQRIWNTALLELDRVKGIRKITGCTLNDVVLAICAGALRRYLDEKGELPDKPLIAMVPVSTRGADEHGKMGNKVSAMFLDIATDVADPVERLNVIKEHTQGGKAFERPMGFHSVRSGQPCPPSLFPVSRLRDAQSGVQCRDHQRAWAAGRHVHGGAQAAGLDGYGPIGGRDGLAHHGAQLQWCAVDQPDLVACGHARFGYVYPVPARIRQRARGSGASPPGARCRSR